MESKDFSFKERAKLNREVNLKTWAEQQELIYYHTQQVPNVSNVKHDWRCQSHLRHFCNRNDVVNICFLLVFKQFSFVSGWNRTVENGSREERQICGIAPRPKRWSKRKIVQITARKTEECSGKRRAREDVSCKGSSHVSTEYEQQYDPEKLGKRTVLWGKFACQKSWEFWVWHKKGISDSVGRNYMYTLKMSEYTVRVEGARHFQPQVSRLACTLRLTRLGQFLPRETVYQFRNK